MNVPRISQSHIEANVRASLERMRKQVLESKDISEEERKDVVACIEQELAKFPQSLPSAS